LSRRRNEETKERKRNEENEEMLHFCVLAGLKAFCRAEETKKRAHPAGKEIKSILSRRRNEETSSSRGIKKSRD